MGREMKMEKSASKSMGRREWAAEVLLLTWAAGTVDAISYLGLRHVFTANMTGNAVLLGISIGQGQGLAATRSLLALLAFIVGVALGALLVQLRSADGEVARALIWPVAAEVVVLGIFALVWHVPMLPQNEGTLYVLIALSAVAMGIQSAAVRRLALPGIATTVITGTITSLVAGLIRWLHLTIISPADGAENPAAPGGGRQLGLQAGVFLVYGAAAASSGFFQERIPLVVGISPFVATLLVLVAAVYSAKHAHSSAE
jgi:uncharacterized membrane protein YoaK (UPF0700 family)